MSDVKWGAGSNAGATPEDVARGNLRIAPTNAPQYDLNNYKSRLSEPGRDDVNPWSNELPADFEFQQRDRMSKGFLTRQREPRERN